MKTGGCPSAVERQLFEPDVVDPYHHRSARRARRDPPSGQLLPYISSEVAVPRIRHHRPAGKIVVPDGIRRLGAARCRNVHESLGCKSPQLPERDGRLPVRDKIIPASRRANHRGQQSPKGSHRRPFVATAARGSFRRTHHPRIQSRRFRERAAG